MDFKSLNSIKRNARENLYIGRVPDKVKTRFKQLASAEFDNDYGSTLHWLLDFRDGLLTNPNEILSGRIEELADEIAGLKKQLADMQAKPKEKIVRRMVNGRKIMKSEE